jgi:type IV secretory pathway VirB2 component (pilin)
MKPQRVLIAMPAGLLYAGSAYAGTTSPMGTVFTTVEGWLTGDIAKFLGICAIVGLGAMIWLAHEFGHMFMHVFRGMLAVGVVVFAITIFTTAFGGGATIAPTDTGGLSLAGLLDASWRCSPLAQLLGLGALIGLGLIIWMASERRHLALAALRTVLAGAVVALALATFTARFAAGGTIDAQPAPRAVAAGSSR